MVAVSLITGVAVAIVVMIHYEILYRLSEWIPRLKIRHRYRIVFGVFGGLTAHVIEIWVFALIYYWMHHSTAWGYLQGNFSATLNDCAYFSFTAYTTLGVGDIEPIGDLRLLVGVESLAGLVLITWTASFLYYEMQRHWTFG